MGSKYVENNLFLRRQSRNSIILVLCEQNKDIVGINIKYRGTIILIVTVYLNIIIICISMRLFPNRTDVWQRINSVADPELFLAPPRIRLCNSICCWWFSIKDCWFISIVQSTIIYIWKCLHQVRNMTVLVHSFLMRFVIWFCHVIIDFPNWFSSEFSIFVILLFTTYSIF